MADFPKIGSRFWQSRWLIFPKSVADFLRAQPRYPEPQLPKPKNTKGMFNYVHTCSKHKNYEAAKHLLLKKVIIKRVRLLKRLEMLNGESRRTDITAENRTTKSISKDITKRKRNNLVYVIYAALPA